MLAIFRFLRCAARLKPDSGRYGYRGAEALRYPKSGSREREINVHGGGTGVSAPQEFCVDLALGYFVS